MNKKIKRNALFHLKFQQRLALYQRGFQRDGLHRHLHSGTQPFCWLYKIIIIIIVVVVVVVVVIIIIIIVVVVVVVIAVDNNNNDRFRAQLMVES
nr:hypothetical protein BaRGS_025355 [Batillaria attramentaria]